MSALGHKQTFGDQRAMSALQPKATSNASVLNVRKRPTARRWSVRVFGSCYAHRSCLQNGASSMIRIVLMVCAAFMLWTSSATAQKAIGPCTADELKLCTGIQPGRDSLRACFRAHIHELSDACLLSLARLTSVDKTCRARLNKDCASVEPGAGRLETCLRSAVAKLSDACKRAFSRAIIVAR